MDYSTMTLNELVDQLNMHWHRFKSSDANNNDPMIDDIQEAMIPLLDELSDDELLDFIDNFKDEPEKIAYQLDEILDNHPIVEKYIQY